MTPVEGLRFELVLTDNQVAHLQDRGALITDPKAMTYLFLQTLLETLEPMTLPFQASLNSYSVVIEGERHMIESLIRSADVATAKMRQMIGMAYLTKEPVRVTAVALGIFTWLANGISIIDLEPSECLLSYNWSRFVAPTLKGVAAKLGSTWEVSNEVRSVRTADQIRLLPCYCYEMKLL